MKNILLSFIALTALQFGYAQNLVIQYDPQTKKAFFQKAIEVRFGFEDDIKKRAVKWAAKTYGWNGYEAGSSWDMYIKGSGVYPNGIKNSGKMQTLAYNFHIEISKGTCNIKITNLTNRDQLLMNDIDRHAFKEDGTRRTNLARLELVESVEKSITDLINSLEKAVNQW